MGKNNVAFCFYLFEFLFLYRASSAWTLKSLSCREVHVWSWFPCTLTCCQPPTAVSFLLGIIDFPLSTGPWLNVTHLRKTWFHIPFSNCCVPCFPSWKKFETVSWLWVSVSPPLLSSLQWVFVSTAPLNRLLPGWVVLSPRLNWFLSRTPPCRAMFFTGLLC